MPADYDHLHHIVAKRNPPGPNFIELLRLSTKICLARHFFLDKNRITNQILMFCIMFVTGIQQLFAYPENPVFIKGEMLYAKQIFVLSISMKLGPAPPSAGGLRYRNY